MRVDEVCRELAMAAHLAVSRPLPATRKPVVIARNGLALTSRDTAYVEHLPLLAMAGLVDGYTGQQNSRANALESLTPVEIGGIGEMHFHDIDVGGVVGRIITTVSTAARALAADAYFVAANVLHVIEETCGLRIRTGVLRRVQDLESLDGPVVEVVAHKVDIEDG